MANEWLEKLASGIMDAEEDAAASHQRLKQQGVIKAQKGQLFFSETVEKLKSDLAALAGMLKADVAAIPIKVTFEERAHMLTIRRENFPKVDATLQLSLTEGMIKLNQRSSSPAAGVGSNFLLQVSDDEGIFIEEAWGTSRARFDQPAAFSQYLIKKLFSKPDTSG